MNKLKTYLNKSCHPIGLAAFRFLFGAVMLFSALRFWVNGWIQSLYLTPSFQFKYFGFEFIEVAPPTLLYTLYFLMCIAALGICLGWYYRLSIVSYFVLFTYFELLDKTYYLNHYYFVSLVSLLLIFLPANKYLSLDVFFGRTKATLIKNYHVWVIKGQIAVLYFFAGVAKIQPDWLFLAQPMHIWLQRYSYLPLVGGLFSLKGTALFCSWFGMLYDTTLPLWLSLKKTRIWAYIAVVLFHGSTAWLFPIGVFPFVMIGATLVFFPNSTFKRIKNLAKKVGVRNEGTNSSFIPKKLLFKYGMLAFFTVQIILPLRYLFYPGNLLWTEEGFNFSWRVMLIEKAGVANFVVEREGQRLEIKNSEYLSPVQEKMMATQPDFILQYARFLSDLYSTETEDAKVFADVFVNLNGRGNQRFIDNSVNLAALNDSFLPKTWIFAPEK